MTPQQVEVALDQLVAASGVRGCALVDAHTGLIWISRGQVPDADRIWEAAVSYWRLHDRQHSEFESLGGLGAAVMYHQHGVLTVLPCCPDPAVLMVSISDHGQVNWIDWQTRVRDLGAVIHRSLRQVAHKA